MRIIAGSFKGRRLFSPEGAEIRPTSDLVRGALFNILGADIEGARFLDLFAGTGAVGLEALSRGAGFVRFCDSSETALKLVKKNAAHVGAKNFSASCADYLSFLNTTGDKYDIIFLDPPYGSDYGAAAVRVILQRSLSPLCILEADSRKATDIDEKNIRRVYKYGAKKLYFIGGEE